MTWGRALVASALQTAPYMPSTGGNLLFSGNVNFNNNVDVDGTLLINGVTVNAGAVTGTSRIGRPDLQQWRRKPVVPI